MTENKNVVTQARVDAQVAMHIKRVSTEWISTRVDVQVLKHTDVIFKQLGITRSRAIEIFLLKVVEHNGLPFEL